jgi:dolichol-phosphate mannosyltransferase
MPIELSCVIPALNEEKCIENVLRELMFSLDSEKLDYEIIAINNGSTDSTGAILDRLHRECPKVRPLHFEINQGFGGAILKGFSQARGAVIGFTCADGEVAPDSIIHLYRIIRGTGADIAKAKRMDRQDGPVRAVLSLGYHFIVRVLFRLNIADMNGYPILLKEHALKTLRLSQPNWMINLEILSGAKRLHLITAELDIPHRRRMGGKSHVDWKTPIVFFAQVVRFWFQTRPRTNSHS